MSRSLYVDACGAVNYRRPKNINATRRPGAASRTSARPNGTVLWRPEHEDGSYRPPRRVFPPGSERVYVRNEGMRACTAELSHDEEKEVYCPHLNAARDERDGRWVNRVPYYYSAYQHGSVSINSKASDSSKAALWDFFVFANVESYGGVVVRAVFTEVVGPYCYGRRLVAGEGRRARGAPVEALCRR